jgi:hypothetical protein
LAAVQFFWLGGNHSAISRSYLNLESCFRANRGCPNTRHGRPEIRRLGRRLCGRSISGFFHGA